MPQKGRNSPTPLGKGLSPKTSGSHGCCPQPSIGVQLVVATHRQPSKRFRDPGTTIYSYLYEYQVRCPECGGCAQVVSKSKESETKTRASLTTTTFTLVCGQCSFFTERPFPSSWNTTPSTPPRDLVFKLPLWLQTRCKGNILWAYNAQHLSDIESMVEAQLREDGQDWRGKMANRTMAARLPRWMLLRKSRSEVMRGLVRLRGKLESGR